MNHRIQEEQRRKVWGLLQTLFTALLSSLFCFLLIPSCSDSDCRRRRLLIICHVLTHGPETKQTLIIKHNYTAHSDTRLETGIIEKEKTKYDNCVREKSNCAKQSYTHLINLASPGDGPVLSEKSYTFSSVLTILFISKCPPEGDLVHRENRLHTSLNTMFI